MERMKDARRPTPLDYALLGLLHQHPMSGYDLRRILETTALGNYSSSPGSIYPALRRLERLGLVEGRVDRAESLRPRKMFRPTPRGQSEMRRWLSQEIAPDDVARDMDGLMLRFAYLGLLDRPTATLRFLEQMEEGVQEYLGELKNQLATFPPRASIQSRLALAAGIEGYRAYLRWARKAKTHFKEARR